MEKKILILLTVLCIAITITFLILVIVLPISRQNNAESESKDHSTPSKENIDLWANFPGELKTQTTHTFSILDYSDDRKTASVKDSIKLNEKTNYANFEFSDQIKFDAISKYEIDKTSTKNAKIKTLSLGLFETLETLSSPEKYQQGINAIEHLIRKGFQCPEIFIKHLYSYKLFTNQTKEDIKNNILKGVDASKQDKILESESEYSLKSALGFDNWIKILGNEKEINEAKWLKDEFNLTLKEIDSIFGANEYLYIMWLDLNTFLAKKYNCKEADFCGIEIIYNQLTTGDVIKDLFPEINTIYGLYSKINNVYYPFEKSPELFIFFEEYKTKHGEAQNYEDYKLTAEQLEKIIDEKSAISLLSSSNAIYFISKIDTKDIKSLADKYEIKENIVNFINEYIYQFLPELLLYNSFNSGDKTLKVTPLVKAYSNMASDMIKKSYYPLSKLNNVFNKVIATLFWQEFRKELNDAEMEYDEEDICYLVMQQVLDDGRKALKICSDPKTSFKKIDEAIKWVDAYRYIMLNETDCDTSVIERLREIVYITEEEIQSIFTTNNFGSILYNSFRQLNDSLQCGDKCYDDKYLIKIQFWKSKISQSLPEGKKSDSLHDLFPELLPYPMELQYYLNKKQITEDIPESSIDYLISLNPAKGDDFLCEENHEAFNNRMQFEKDFTSYINGQSNDIKEISHLFDLLNDFFLFDDIVNVEYESIGDILQGNNKEDKIYLDYLTNGEYYNNHKPGMNKTSGFNFGRNLDTGEEIYVPYDKYSIDINTLRKIISINNEPYMNIKKVEYDHVCNDYIYVDEPILNYQSLTGEQSFIDGFQYNHEDDTIYYFDKISSRPYKFTFDEEIDYEDQTCRKYILDTQDYKPKMASLSQKLNKPLYISVGNNGFDTTVNGEIKDENYICVEPYSNMVLESKMNLVYSLYTKNYGFLYPKIENEKNYPIFIYNKDYKVDINSFNDAFPEINSAKNFKTYFLIFGIIILVVFACLSGFLIYKWKYHKRERISLGPEAPDMNLINDSREATLNKTTDTE